MKRVIGGKRGDTVATAVVNPKTGNLVVSNAEIKKVSLQYCIETLSSNLPAEGFQKVFEDKK